MRRSPFYTYPTFPYGPYAPPAQESAYLNRPRRPFPPSSPARAPTAPNPRSVINIPVFDSAPSQPSSSLPQKHSNSPSSPPSPAVALIDPLSAATKIQSHFRGFNVRRHRPLLHLHSIANARKQLEELRSELESPEFLVKMRTREKERLRFSESVMSIILRLDAIEGSLEEVRSRRKEATKMAIKLQDAIDAIILQREENAGIQPTDEPFPDGAMAPDEGSVLCDLPDVRSMLEESIVDLNPMQKESTPLEESVAVKCMSNVNNQDMVDDIVPPLLLINVEDADHQVESGMSIPCCLEAVPKHVEQMHEAEQEMIPIDGENVAVMHTGEQGMTIVTRENASNNIMDAMAMHDESIFPEEDVTEKCMPGGDNQDMVDDIVPSLLPIKVEDVDQQGMTHATSENSGEGPIHGVEEEENNGIEVLPFVVPNSHAQGNALVAMVNEDTSVDDLDGYAQEASSDWSYPCMDVIQKVEEGSKQDVVLSSRTPIAEEKCDYSHCCNGSCENQLQGPLTPVKMLTEGDCCLDGKGAPTLHRCGVLENCSDVAYDNTRGVANSCNEENTQSSSLSMVKMSSSPDNALLLQLSKDCKQLRSLVSKLLMQNRAQSKVLSALGERLELLEQQQELNCQQQTRQKRKVGKGSKRSSKIFHEEW